MALGEIGIVEGPNRWDLLIYGLQEGEAVNFKFSKPLVEFGFKYRFPWLGSIRNRREHNCWIQIHIVSVTRDTRGGYQSEHGSTDSWIIQLQRTDQEYDSSGHETQRKIRFEVKAHYNTRTRSGVVLTWSGRLVA